MLSYIGGKKFQSKHISSNFPSGYDCYVEPFGGAFWVYFRGDVEANRIVYNDINPYMTNIFCCASKDTENFLEILESVEAQDSDLFIKFRDEIFARGLDTEIDMPDCQLAMKYLYLQTQVFAGNTLGPKTNMTHLHGKYRSKYYQFVDKLENDLYLNRLEKITDFQSLPFEYVIKKYDSKETLFYCDPPYYNLEKYYTCSECDHEKLAEVLNSIDGKFVLSYYDYPLLDSWYPSNKFKRVYRQFNNQNGNRLKEKSSKRVELLIIKE